MWLDSLHNYSDEWNLQLNTAKTKILVFRNGKKYQPEVGWKYEGHELEVVDTFNYLGLVLLYNGKFRQAQLNIAGQGRKAIFALPTKFKNHNFNVATKLSMFDTYVKSILSYGSEIWGFHKAPDVEKVHLMFCKKLLGVKKSTSNYMVYCELGRLPLRIYRLLRIFKYWLKVRNSQNCITKSCYNERILFNDEWIVNIKKELCTLGLNYLFDCELPDKAIYCIIEQRIFDTTKQHIFANIASMSRGLIYQHLVDNFCLQYYLTKSIDWKFKKLLIKFRISAHSLNIEKGRHSGVRRNDRNCSKCNSTSVEDEFHFILECLFYRELRSKYIKRYYFNHPSTFKLVQLLSVQNNKELVNLGKYLYFASVKRES